jgi:hypothetical protein
LRPTGVPAQAWVLHAGPLLSILPLQNLPQLGDFCLTEIFFFFLVGRNSANFAPACPRKSFVARRLARGSAAKLSEFRPGGGAKIVRGGAKFVGRMTLAQPSVDSKQAGLTEASYSRGLQQLRVFNDRARTLSETIPQWTTSYRLKMGAFRVRIH